MSQLEYAPPFGLPSIDELLEMEERSGGLQHNVFGDPEAHLPTHQHEASPDSPPSSPEAQPITLSVNKPPGRKRTQTATVSSSSSSARQKRKYARRAPNAKEIEAKAKNLEDFIADPEGIRDMREYDGEGDPYANQPKTPAAAASAGGTLAPIPAIQVDESMPDVAERGLCDQPVSLGPIERFTFERDPRARAGLVKPYWVPVGDNHARDRTAGDASYSVKQRAFSIAINIDRNGLGAMSSPFAASFFANPYVAEHLVKCWKQFADLPATVDPREWALKDFAAQGCYDRAASAINEALVKQGLGELEVLSQQLPLPSVAPRQKSDPNKLRKTRTGELVPRKSAHSDLIESAAPLDVRFPIPRDSLLYTARKEIAERAYIKAKDTLSTGDPRGSVGRERHRASRLPNFPSLVAASNAIPCVPPPDAELFAVLDLDKQQTEEDQQLDDAGGYSDEVMDHGLLNELQAPAGAPAPAAGEELPSSPVVEVAPPAVVVRAMCAFMCSLRGTTTNVGIVSCTPVARSVGVELRPVERVALCV